MATLRNFILNQSSLPTGNMVRDHIKNPSAGSGGVIINVSEVYNVAYVGELDQVITYAPRKSIVIAFEKEVQLIVSVQTVMMHNIKYVPQDEINTDLI